MFKPKFSLTNIIIMHTIILKKILKNPPQKSILINTHLILAKPEQSFIKSSQVKAKFLNASPYAKTLKKVRSQSKFQKKPNHSLLNSCIGSVLDTISSVETLTKTLSSTKHKELKIINKYNFKTKSKNAINTVLNSNNTPPKLEKENFFWKSEQKLLILKKHQNENPLNTQIFESYKDIFSEIIEKDKVFGNSLKTIKEAYEQWIKIKIDLVDENSQLKYEILKLNDIIKDMQQEAALIVKNLKKLSGENVAFGRELELKDKQYRCLQEHLIKVSNISIDEYPQNEEMWKQILAENKTYSDICYNMKKDIKKLEVNEKCFLKLLDCIRDEGFPVDRVYRSKIENDWKYKKNKKNVRVNPVNSEDDEVINTIPAKQRKKPAGIPKLNLEKIEPDSFSKNDDSVHNPDI